MIKNITKILKKNPYLKFEIMGFILLIVIIVLMTIYVPKIFSKYFEENKEKQ